MPPKKPAAPVKGAKSDVGAEVSAALDALWPPWNDADLATIVWTEPVADQVALPSESQEKVANWVKFGELVKDAPVVYLPQSLRPVTPDADTAAAGKKPAAKAPAKPAATGKGAPPPVAVVAPRPALSPFSKQTLAQPSLAGLVTQIQLIAGAAEKIPAGSLLWENIYPKEPTTGLAQNTGSKYAVRLFIFGSWRRVIVDDTVPVDAANVPLLPTTVHNELWPILLAKALLRVAGAECANAILSAHPAAVHWLTSWWPHVKDISGADELWSTLQSPPAADTVVALGDPVQQLQPYVDARVSAGLPKDCLYQIKRTVAAEWNIRDHYKTYERSARLLQLRNVFERWEGAYSHTDITTWTREFETSIGEQHHIRKKAKVDDFFIDVSDAARFFTALHSFRAVSAPAAWEYTHLGVAGQTNTPQLLFVEGTDDVTIDLLVTSSQPVTISLTPYDWKSTKAQQPALSAYAAPASCTSLTVTSACRLFQLDALTTGPFAVVFRSTGKCTIGPADDILTGSAGVAQTVVEGDSAASTAGQWQLWTRQKITIDKAAVVTAALSVDAPVLPLVRAQLIAQDTLKEVPLVGMKLPPTELQPGVSYIFVLHSAPKDALPPSHWKLVLQTSGATIKVDALPAPGRFPFEGDAKPNEARRELCRYAVLTKAACVVCARVSVNAAVPVTLTLLKQREVALTATAVGAAVLPFINLDLIDQEPKKPGKGELPAVQKYNYVLVATLPGDTLPEAVHWDLVVVSTADQKTVTVKVDDEQTQELASMVAAWEKPQPGRAAKAKASRDQHHQRLTTGDWGTDGPPPEPQYVTAAEPVLLPDDYIPSLQQATAQALEQYTQKRTAATQARTDAGAQRTAEAAAIQETATAMRREVKVFLDETAAYHKEYNAKRHPPPEPVVPEKKGAKAKPPAKK